MMFVCLDGWSDACSVFTVLTQHIPVTADFYKYFNSLFLN